MRKACSVKQINMLDMITIYSIRVLLYIQIIIKWKVLMFTNTIIEQQRKGNTMLIISIGEPGDNMPDQLINSTLVDYLIVCAINLPVTVSITVYSKDNISNKM